MRLLPKSSMMITTRMRMCQILRSASIAVPWQAGTRQRYRAVYRNAMSRRRSLALLWAGGAILAPSGGRAQEPELPLDRLTPAAVRQLVDSSIATATLYRDSLLALRSRRTVRNTLRLYDEMSIAFNLAQIAN